MKPQLLTRHQDTLDLIHDFITEVTESIDRDAWYSHVDEVSSESFPGFIPYTDGGWDGVIAFGFYSEEAYSTPEIARHHDRDRDFMNEMFRESVGLEADVEVGEDTEGYDDFRDEWEQNDTASWFVKIRALFYMEGDRRNVSGEDEVIICFGINDDFEYGRDNFEAWRGGGTHWKWERNIPLSQVTPELLAECRAEIFKSW